MMVLSGCAHIRPCYCGTKAASVSGVRDRSCPEHMYSHSSETHVGFFGSAPIRVLLRYLLHPMPATRAFRYCLPSVPHPSSRCSKTKSITFGSALIRLGYISFDRRNSERCLPFRVIP